MDSAEESDLANLVAQPEVKEYLSLEDSEVGILARFFRRCSKIIAVHGHQQDDQRKASIY